MGVIGVSSTHRRVWQAAGWAFRQILDDVSSYFPEDIELASEFELAKLYDSLSVSDLPSPLSERATSMIRLVATMILAGELKSGLLEKPYGDAKTEADYRVGLRSLLEVLSDC